MGLIPQGIIKLIESFAKLPGIGTKTASRLAFYLLKKDEGDLKRFAQALEGLKENIHTCGICFSVAESDPCPICSSSRRDRTKLCVVEEPLDVFAIEKTGQFEGLYHVLGGTISPINNVGPADLRIAELVKRLKEPTSTVGEIFLATNPDLEGDATAMYIERKIKDLKIKKTRLARGLPTGGDLEYADETTLRKAIEGRQEF